MRTGTPPSRMRLVAIAAAPMLALVSLAAPTAADDCLVENPETGELTYVCGADGQPGGGGGGTGGPGGGGGGGGTAAPPPCDLEAPYDEFCEGTAACWGNDPAANQPSEELTGTPRPSEEHHMAYKACLRADGTTYDEWYWSTGGTQQAPSPAQLAQLAFGRLTTPAFSVATSPAGRTLVNLDTWWWAQGAGPGEITGSAALGVVAIGTPNRIEVDPGDGTGVLACDFVTTESEECSHVYRRASRPTYDARMRLVYAVRIERNGAPLEVAGIPTELPSPWQTTALEVDEVQSVVRP